MGLYGYIFAGALFPALLACFLTPAFRALGVIMFFKWVAFTIPFRAQINKHETFLHLDGFYPPGEIAESGFYFSTIALLAVVAMRLFCFDLRPARWIMGLLALSIASSYYPYELRLIDKHISMVIAEVYGYLQIFIIVGASGGFLYKRFSIRFKSISPNMGMANKLLGIHSAAVDFIGRLACLEAFKAKTDPRTNSRHNQKNPFNHRKAAK